MARRDLTKEQSVSRQDANRAHRQKVPHALQAYAAYLAEMPDDGWMWSNLGAMHRKQGRNAQALRAQECGPNDIGMRNNYANILSDLGDYNASITQRRAIREQHPDDANQKSMIGRCLRGQGDYCGAIVYLKAIIVDHPEDSELRTQVAFAQLGAGDCRNVFQSYGARWATDKLAPRDQPYPEWRGESLVGKTIFVLPEQGFCDAILFMRFVLAPKALGAIVWVLAKKPVYPLFVVLEDVVWVGTSVPASASVDCWVNLMDMATVHFSQSDAVPLPAKTSVPADAHERTKAIVAPFENVFKVDVVSTGSVTYEGNGFLSFLHTDFLPLVDILGVQLFSLCKGRKLKAFQAGGSNATSVDTASTEQNFGDSAAMMGQMDLVISSDTATAHLAGSLGVPIWTILHWDPFWVWRHVGDVTEWYPGMHLFRQSEALEWTNVLTEVSTALRAKTGDCA